MYRTLPIVALLAVAACSSDDNNTNNGSVDAGTDLSIDREVGPDTGSDMAADTGADLSDGPSWEDLTEVLSPPVDDGTMPSLSALVFDGDEIIAAGAVGLRRLGSPNEVSLQDKHHLASLSKPFTATLAARLVDQGAIDWTTTVDIFGFDDLDPAFEGVTLLDLLTHQAGLTENDVVIDDWETTGARAARVEIARYLLTNPPKYEVGSFSYSNSSIVVAASMLEVAANDDWQVLMQAEVFDPLALDSCGFGWPAGARVEEQPAPHGLLGGAPSPRPSGENWDNADPPMFPAGNIHCSLQDVAKLGRVYFGTDTSFLDASTLAFLAETKVALGYSTRHGMGWHTGAWMTTDRSTLFHSGSYIGSNLTHLHLSPGAERGVMISTNIYSPAADAAATAIFKQLENDYF